MSRIWESHRLGWVILQPGVSGSGATGVAAEPLDSAGDGSGALAIPVHVFKKGHRGSPGQHGLLGVPVLS